MGKSGAKASAVNEYKKRVLEDAHSPGCQAADSARPPARVVARLEVGVHPELHARLAAMAATLRSTKAPANSEADLRPAPHFLRTPPTSATSS